LKSRFGGSDRHFEAPAKNTGSLIFSTIERTTEYNARPATQYQKYVN
jgi:hypothetical protein